MNTKIVMLPTAEGLVEDIENLAWDCHDAGLRLEVHAERLALALLRDPKEWGAELLEGNLGGTRIFPLYGMLPKEEQRRAIAPSRPGERKVVLATSIAETSLTIEGVRVVVDSGLCRKMIFDRRNGMSHLETVRISIDMADQRSGRASVCKVDSSDMLNFVTFTHTVAAENTFA